LATTDVAGGQNVSRQRSVGAGSQHGRMTSGDHEQDFWQRVLTQPVRQAGHVAHAIEMVGRLPGRMVTISEPTVHHACLESFLVHVRALAEFLIVHKGNAEKDFTVEDFGSQAPAPDDPRRERLEDVWTLTSQNLVHFSRERTPEDLYDLRPPDYLTPEGHKGTAGQVLSLVEDFVVGLEARGTDPDAARRFRHALTTAMEYRG
jgi:hypothetical protein